MIYYSILWYTVVYYGILWYTVMCCALQIHCDILWHTVIYCNVLWYAMVYCDILYLIQRHTGGYRVSLKQIFPPIHCSQGSGLAELHREKKLNFKEHFDCNILLSTLKFTCGTISMW